MWRSVVFVVHYHATLHLLSMLATGRTVRCFQRALRAASSNRGHGFHLAILTY